MFLTSAKLRKRVGEMAERKLTPRGEFDKALARHAPAFGISPGADLRVRLGDYFELVMRWNPRLHLVAPCSPEEFATRHVLESLAALAFLPEGVTFVEDERDITTSGGAEHEMR